jgi:site-specific DNA-methyltransferase (adenine-specific)
MLKCDLIHGDCLYLLPMLADASIGLVAADLPYACTRAAWDSLLPLGYLFEQYWRVLEPDGAVVLTADMRFASLLLAAAPREFRFDIAWDKVNRHSGFLSSRRRPLKCHESVLVFSRGVYPYTPDVIAHSRRKRRRGGGKASPLYNNTVAIGSANEAPAERSVWRIGYEKSDAGKHNTQKPVALFRRIIRTFSRPGATVLDNTMGSGTTAVAAMAEGRGFVGMENDPEFYAVAEDRLQLRQGLFAGLTHAHP